MAVATLTIKIDENIKRKAEAVFAENGMTPTSAISLLYHQTAQDRAFPFVWQPDEAWYNSLENLEAFAEAEEIMRDPNRKGFWTVEELVADILSGDDDD